MVYKHIVEWKKKIEQNPEVVEKYENLIGAFELPQIRGNIPRPNLEKNYMPC